GRDLGLLLQPFGFNVAIQSAGEGSTKPCQVRSTIALRNVVGEAVDIFLKTIVPLQRHFDGNTIIALLVEMEYPVDRVLVLIQIFDKGLEAAFVSKHLVLAGAFILEQDVHTTVQER